MFGRDLRLSDGKGGDHRRGEDHGYPPMCIFTTLARMSERVRSLEEDSDRSGHEED